MKYIITTITLLFFINLVTFAQTSTPTIRLCPGDTVKLSAYSHDADSYRWFKDGNVIDGKNEQFIQVHEFGEYSVMALNKYGCESDLSKAVLVLRSDLGAMKDSADVHITSSIAIPVVVNDWKGCSDLDSNSIIIVDLPRQGTALPRADGTINYIPYYNASGYDRFFYTVKDLDGNVSNPAEVIVSIGKECGIVYPNPVTDILKVDSRNKHVTTLRVCDLSGKILLVAPMDIVPKELSLKGLAEGVYILHLLDDDGKTYCTFKVFKSL